MKSINLLLPITMTLLITIFGCNDNSITDESMWSKSYNKETIGLDVRTTRELKSNPSLGSVNIPVSDLANNISSKIPSKNTAIYVFCESGGRSSKAHKLLKELGYTNITDIKTWRNWNKILK